MDEYVKFYLLVNLEQKSGQVDTVLLAVEF